MKLLHIDLYTADLDATSSFYISKLGLPVHSRSTAHLTVVIGWTYLTFRQVDQPVAPYHLAINVPRGSLEVLMYYFNLAYIDTQAPGKTIADFPDWRARSCYFYESPEKPEASNILEFIARTDLQLEDPNLTFTDLFQGVSEIGIATEDVAYTTDQLQRLYGVPQFDKMMPLSDFNALGDDNGLFIVSQVGRNWPFTNTPVGLNYLRVNFTSSVPPVAIQELYAFTVNRVPIGKGRQSLISPSIF